jgi:ABC-2 type transport system permease protein
VSVRFLLASARKDLQWRRRDPVALLIWIGIPFALAILLGLVSGSGGPPRARLLLVDQDDSFVSRLLVSAARSGQAQELLDVETVSLDEGRARIAAGRASALLILPAGFGDAVLLEQPAQLSLVTNPAQRFLPDVVRGGVEILVEATFYLQRLMGEPLRDIVVGPESDETFVADAVVAGISTDINRRLRAIEGVLLPPVLTVTAETVGAAPVATTSFALLFFPGALLLSLLFIAEGMSADIWKEKEQGVLRRVASAPHHVALFVGGRLAAGFVMMLIVCAGGLVLGAMVFDLPAWRLPLALAWCAFAGTALLAFFLFLQTLGSSSRTANLLTMMVLFPMVMIGGSLFPLEVMPAWMAAIGGWTPNGFALVTLKGLLGGTADVAEFALAVLIIGLFGLASFALVIRRVGGSFVTG